jgi:hypothetical protein
MKILLVKRSLVFVIILLFIGLSVTSSIHAHNGKINNQKNEETPDNFPLNNAYTNGYWKFDEGNGNTAYDSSDHNYDGTIYGASWTSGYSGDALDFDGVNDYVSLDDYAANNLGYNKTDDLIFSLYFKTTSNSKGVIYSVSAPEYNPGHHIAMNSDGTIEFRVWRLSCGIMLTSEGTYNDGEWHYVEIWYNGMPANPIVEMYVDDDLDTSLEYYVCSFEANMFTKAKIGTRSNDTVEYFDGVIDEVKVIKYPGGNKQNPPSISGPDIGISGVTYQYTFKTNDPEGDDIWLYVDWDDGTYEEWIGPYSSGEEVVLSHEWDIDDRYEIRAQSKDVWDNSHSSKHTVKIGNQPPLEPTIDGPKHGDPNEQLTYTIISIDEEDEDIKYTINWDDGNIDETSYVESNTPIQVSHSWNTKDDYFIKVKAEDEHYKPSDWTIYHIRIGDQPPGVPDIYGAMQGYPDIFYEFGFISVDPENDNLTYDIEWGDGYTETDLGPVPSGKIFARSHKWNETGNFNVRARAKDEFNNYGEWSQYKINVPKNKVFNINFLEMLFERFPFAFLIFKNLLGLLKYDIGLLEN